MTRVYILQLSLTLLIMPLFTFAQAGNKQPQVQQEPVDNQVKGTLYGSRTNASPKPSYNNPYQSGLVFPRSLESNRTANPWSQKRESVQVPNNQLPILPKGNPWAAQSIDQLERPKDSKDKNPYTDAPSFNQQLQNPYMPSPYESNYNSSYPMLYHNGYYSNRNSFPSPFDDTFWPGGGQFWPGNNHNSFPFMPW